MNILIFPASVRKIWIDNFRHIRNPSYCLLGWLVKRLSYSTNVYIAGDSVEQVGALHKWRGELIDKILILGADYVPFNTSIRYKNGLPQNGPFAKARPSSKQIYDIANDLKKLKDSPPIYFLSVDVRGWESDVESIINIRPDIIIDEQTMHWQEIGYLVVNRLESRLASKFREGFGFHGHMKDRGTKGIGYFKNLCVPLTIDGMGWDKFLDNDSNVVCRGQQVFLESARMMFTKKYSLTMHEPRGNSVGWITARYFENLAFGVVNFVDSEYDMNERVIKKNNWRRISSPEELNTKIKILEQDENQYKKILEEQNREINPKWLNFEKFFYQPFKKKLEL